MIKTKEDFFARQEPRDFPLPKKRKPYTNARATSWGRHRIVIALKDTGSGKLDLYLDGEKTDSLYFQGTNWRELTSEALMLRGILTAPQGLDNPPALVVD